ncbi:hypothetical protein WDW37_05350 [Bdellovibrionota bacterium FG-1]
MKHPTLARELKKARAGIFTWGKQRTRLCDLVHYERWVDKVIRLACIIGFMKLLSIGLFCISEILFGASYATAQKTSPPPKKVKCMIRGTDTPEQQIEGAISKENKNSVEKEINGVFVYAAMSDGSKVMTMGITDTITKAVSTTLVTERKRYQQLSYTRGGKDLDVFCRFD